MTERAAVDFALAQAHRRDWAYVVAATVRAVRDLDLAEECVQEAYAAALNSWPRDGVPANPTAWLTTAARRRGIDLVRRDRSLRSKLPLLVIPEEREPSGDPAAMIMDQRLQAPDPTDLEAALPDERLRLIFLCCHPALTQEAQVALTLRLVCGVPTPDIARAFLVPESTMAARLTRAKKKIAGSRIPYRVPRPADLPERLRGVLGVIHLLFTAGHTAPSGDALLRVDLLESALHLARMLQGLMPDEPEVGGLLALLLVTDARRATRVSDTGGLVRLEDQDRSRWDRDAIAEAQELIMAALGAGPAGRYLLQAAIAAVYAEAASYQETDWAQLLVLYDNLLQVWPSPVVALNRTVPLSRVAGPAAALAEVEALEQRGQLAGYQYLPAVKADLLARLDRPAQAAAACRQALALTRNTAERDLLADRLAALESRSTEQG